MGADQKPIALSNTSYLMVYKDKKQNIHAEWVTVIPGAERKNDKFVGLIAIEDWNGSFIRGFAMDENGTVKPVYLSDAINYTKTNTLTSFSCFTVEYWGAVGVDGYLESILLGSETYCFGNGGGGWVENGVDNFDPGGGGPMGDTYPTDYTSVPDCTGTLNGTAYDSSCGCIVQTV